MRSGEARQFVDTMRDAFRDGRPRWQTIPQGDAAPRALAPHASAPSAAESPSVPGTAAFRGGPSSSRCRGRDGGVRRRSDSRRRHVRRRRRGATRAVAAAYLAIAPISSHSRHAHAAHRRPAHRAPALGRSACSRCGALLRARTEPDASRARSSPRGDSPRRDRRDVCRGRVCCRGRWRSSSCPTKRCSPSTSTRTRSTRTTDAPAGPTTTCAPGIAAPGFDVAYITDHRTFEGAERGVAANPPRGGRGNDDPAGTRSVLQGEHVNILSAGRRYKGIVTRRPRRRR